MRITTLERHLSDNWEYGIWLVELSPLNSPFRQPGAPPPSSLVFDGGGGWWCGCRTITEAGCSILLPAVLWLLWISLFSHKPLVFNLCCVVQRACPSSFVCEVCALSLIGYRPNLSSLEGSVLVTVCLSSAPPFAFFLC